MGLPVYVIPYESASFITNALSISGIKIELIDSCKNTEETNRPPLNAKDPVTIQKYIVTSNSQTVYITAFLGTERDAKRISGITGTVAFIQSKNPNIKQGVFSLVGTVERTLICAGTAGTPQTFNYIYAYNELSVDKTSQVFQDHLPNLKWVRTHGQEDFSIIGGKCFGVRIYRGRSMSDGKKCQYIALSYYPSLMRIFDFKSTHNRIKRLVCNLKGTAEG